MNPKYHTLITRGTEITCNPIMPPLYQLENSWWQINLQMYPSPEPIELSPNSLAQWKVKSPSYLATAGIYSEEELNKLRDHIMYGDERQAIENVLVRSFTGQTPDLQGGNYAHMIDDQALNKLGTRLGSKIWGWFSVFGNFAAGIIGILSCIQIVKWVADTIIHGKALFDIYGWSIKILAAGWDSLTLCLLHKGQDVNNIKNQDLASHESNGPEQILIHQRESTSTSTNSFNNTISPTLYPLLPSSPPQEVNRHVLLQKRLDHKFS